MRFTARRREPGGPVLHLHAREIVVPLYKNRAPIRVVAPAPQHMRERLTLCGWRGEGNEENDEGGAAYFNKSSL